MIMVNRKKIVFSLTYLSVSALIIAGVITMMGTFTKPEIHAFEYEFEYDESLVILSLRFESSTGVFVTGETINVNALLGYHKGETEFHLLYFPNVLEPDEYKELLSKENFGKLIPNEDGSGVSFKAGHGKILHNLGNFPPTSEFDVVWTQDGPKDAILIMNAESISMSEEQLRKDGMLIEKIITIQPSNVKLQMQSNNVSLGLALIIIAITILTAFFGVEKIWFLPKTS